MTAWIFTPIILVCLGGQSRDECQPPTAEMVITGEPSGNEIMCNKYSQMQLAGTSIGRGLRDGEWIKIMCDRKPK